MRYKVVIPARYAAERLPGKPLLDIAGKSMVQRVYENAKQSMAAEIYVATDDQRIIDAVDNLGGTAVFTDPKHPSGTSRIAEVAELFGWDNDDIVINLQGDEPLIPGSYLDQLAALKISNPEIAMASLCSPVKTSKELADPNVVKVVLDKNGRALYFSRSVIPYDRKQLWQANPVGYHWGRHLGLYAYSVGFLKHYARLAISPLEQLESLEQLRALWHGYEIQLGWVSQAYPSVDVAEDLARVLEAL